jgi:hypothetical protein
MFDRTGVPIMQFTPRTTPLVLIVALDRAVADSAVERWHAEGAVVVQARHASGCLRVATAIGPDIIILDRRLPPELHALLSAHPVSARARIELIPVSSQMQAGLEAPLRTQAPLHARVAGLTDSAVCHA